MELGLTMALVSVVSVRLDILACKCSSKSFVETRDLVTLSLSIDTTFISKHETKAG